MITVQDLDVYVCTNYPKLTRKYGADIVSELYIHFKRVLTTPSMAQPRNLAACFSTAAFNQTVDTYRRKQREGVEMEIEAANLKTEAVALVELEADATSNAIREAVEQLPTKQRIALKLWMYNDMSFKQVAEVMQCPYDTAKAHYRHAMLKLRAVLTKEGAIYA